MGTRAFLLTVGLVLLAAEISTAASLTVRVTGMDNRKGQLKVGIFAGPDGWLADKSAITGQNVMLANVSGDVAVVTFNDLKPGVYGVGVYQDANMNNKLDKNVFGVPKEQWGVSNNVRPHLRAPTYDEAKFTVTEPSTSIDIALHR